MHVTRLVVGAVCVRKSLADFHLCFACSGVSLAFAALPDSSLLFFVWLHFAGTRLVTGGEDGVLHIWSIKSGKSELKIEGAFEAAR